MADNRSGIRELQIAQGLITLRWASIPLIFGFAIISRQFFGMVFRIEPIYVLCCLLAILNIFFTLHFAVLSRQMGLSHGITGLKRLILKIISSSFADIKNRGLKGIMNIPISGLKIFTVLYMMLIESLKDLSFNPFSLQNIMHSQIISDLLVITLLARFTGTTESPIFFLSVIPVTVAGAVIGFKAGAVYSAVAVGAWITISFMIKSGFMSHIKFYSPLYGDLSACNGWIATSSLVSVAGLGATAFLAHKLTSNFKERIFFLNDLLFKSRMRAISATSAAEQASDSWLIMDCQANIEKVKTDKNGIFIAELAGKNLLTTFPELEQYGLAYVIQAVVTSGAKRRVDKIKITSKEGTQHLFNLRVSNFKGSDDKMRILAFFEDITEISFLKSQSEQLKSQIIDTKSKLENTSISNSEHKRLYDEALKLANNRNVEIEILNHRINSLRVLEASQNDQINRLMDELASVKTANDELKSDLEYKNLILEEVAGLMSLCNEIDELTVHIEDRARKLFQIDSTCLHLFETHDNKRQIGEILDIRKASPRLLDLPRNNPNALNPVLEEGRPLVINAQINAEQAASMTINNGVTQRMVAYIPIKNNQRLIGMMMLERFGQETNSSNLIEMLSYYLKHASAAIQAGIDNREQQKRKDEANQQLRHISKQLESVRSMIFSQPDNSDHIFQHLLNALNNVKTFKDMLFVRVHNDDSLEVTARIDNSKQQILNTAENKLMEAVREKPNHKATLLMEDENESCTAFPLFHNNRLLGAIVAYTTDGESEDTGIIDFCIRLIRDQLALKVLGEEKEIWETFYQENLSA